MGDSKPISKSDLRSLFGSLLGGSSNSNASSSSSTKEAVTTVAEMATGEDYRKSNQILVIRNCQLKNEISKVKKEMDSLRSENTSLRERLSQMESATEDERIELMVAQRVESRVRQIRCMVDRSVKFLQKTSEDLGGMFGDSEETNENIVPVTRPKSIQPLSKKPNLPKVEESPLRRPSSQSEHEFIAPLPPPPSTSTLPPSQPSSSSNRGKSPMRIRPRTPKRERGSTPTPSSPPGPFDSTRRKRSATLKIPSLKEPSLQTKARRPAGFDPRQDYI